MPIGAVVGAVGAVAGGISSSRAAKKAASAQTRAAEQDLAFQRETRDLIFDRLDPWYQGGNLANQALMYEMGLAERPMVGANTLTVEEIPGAESTSSGNPRVDAALASNSMLAPFFQQLSGGLGGVGRTGAASSTPTRFRVGSQTFNTREEAEAYAKANSTTGTPYRGFTATPSYNFRLEQGQDAVNALAGARGGLFSGRTLQDLTSFNQGLASQEYDNYLSRLGGLAGQGLNAASGQATAATNEAAGVSNALGGIGNAQAAGAIGQGNAWTSAINNGIGTWQYMQGLNTGIRNPAIQTAANPANAFFLGGR